MFFFPLFWERSSPNDARLCLLMRLKSDEMKVERGGGRGKEGRAPLHATDEGIRRRSNWLAVNSSLYFLSEIKDAHTGQVGVGVFVFSSFFFS